MDLFDEIEVVDIFDEVEPTPKIELDIFDETADITSLVRSELAKIKPSQQIIERTIQTLQVPVHQPPQIIKEVRVEVQVPKKDSRKFVEQSEIEALKSAIEELRKELTETRRRADAPIVIPGGSGVIGLPIPEGNDGRYLTVSGNKPVWGTVSDSSSTSTVPLGDPTTDGSWQIVISDTNLSFQRRESGSWVEKGSMLA